LGGKSHSSKGLLVGETFPFFDHPSYFIKVTILL
jgi:hypothetical protein